MAEEDFFHTSIEKIVSDASIRDKLVVTASRMLDYLDHKFIENIELDSFRVDISIIKRSNSKFNICVYENEFIRDHTKDDYDTPKKDYRAISTSIKDLVVELIDLLNYNFALKQKVANSLQGSKLAIPCFYLSST